jgi:hypothetical protein
MVSLISITPDEVAHCDKAFMAHLANNTAIMPWNADPNFIAGSNLAVLVFATSFGEKAM